MKYFLILILLCGFNALAETDSDFISKLNYKPIVGLTYSFLNYDDNYKGDLEPSFDASFEFSFLLGFLVELEYKDFVFATGLQYASYRSEVSGVTGNGLISDTGEIDVTHKLDYLQVPVNVTTYLNSFINGFHIQAGLIPSFLIHSKRSFEFSNPFFINNSPDLEDDIKGFDVILSTGFGYTFKLSNMMFDASFNYHQGTIKVDDTEANQDARNSSFIMQLGVSL